MSSIDHRIVEMRFNSAQFEKGVKNTTESLAKLENSLKLDQMASGIEKVSSKFNVFGAIGFTAIQRLTDGAIGFGQKIAGAVLDPLIEGGKKRAQNIELAKFQFEGLGLDVEKAMANALYAVEGTAYGLDEAARAASQFAASGVELGEDMENALRGVSGLAAMTGSSYEDVSSIFGKVAGQGRLMGDDLNRIGARGVNAAAELAKSFNVTEEELRKMVSRGEIDFQTFAEAMNDAFGEHATKANETYAGSFANMRAALSRIGAEFATIKFEKHRRIFNALIPVINGAKAALEPFIDLYERLSAAAARRWENFLGGIDLSQLERITLPLANIVATVVRLAEEISEPIKAAFDQIFRSGEGPTWIDNAADALWSLSRSISDLSPSKDTLDKIQRSFAGLFAVIDIGWMIIKGVLGVFGDLFGSLFSIETGFLGVTASVGDWLVSVRDALKEGEGLSKFFEGLGKVLKLPIEAFKALIGVVKDLVSAIFDLDGEGFSGFAEKAKERFEPLGKVGEAIAKAWSKIAPAFEKAYEIAKPIFEKVIGWFKELGSKIVDSFSEADFSLVFDAINTGIFAAIGMGIRKFFSGLGDLVSSGGGLKDIANSIASIFDGITGSLKAMQDNLRAKTLLTIAGALALLTASIVVLSGIDSKKMASALAGLTAMFIQLMGALAIFNKISATGMYLKLPVVAAGLLILAGALVILSSAVEKMSDLEWEGLLKGLTGVTALLAVMAGVTQIMKTRMGGMITTAIGMVILASAVRILYGAVENFSGLSWADMAKGLTGVAAVLLALSLFSQFSKASLKAVPQAIGITILASAIKILYTAVRDFATMKWEEIGRGLAAMAGALGILAIAMQFISGSSILGGVGLAIVSASLLILADALQEMGKMSWGEIGRSLTLMLGAMTIIAAAMWAMIEALPGALAMIIIAPALVILADALERFGEMEWAEIGKALTLLAGSLAAIALAMMGMTGAVPGALALIVVAGALSILAPILKLFGGMEWDEIGKGLVALAGVLGVIAVTSLLLSPAIPLIAGLGIAIGILGVAVLAAGAGVLAFAIALGMLAASGAAGMNFLIDTVDRLIDLIPKAMEKFGEGVVKFAEVIEDGAPAIGRAMTAIFEEMIRAFDRIAPLVVETMAELVVRIAEAMAARADRLANAAVTLVTTFLNTMAEEAPRMAEAGYKLVVALAGSILFYAWKFVDKAGLMIALFIAAIARSVNRRAPQIRRAGGQLATAIIDGITGGLFSRFAQSRVVQAAVNLARRAVNAAKNALGIASPSKVFREIGEFAGEGLAIGITDTQREVGLSAEELGDSATMRLQRAMANLPDALDGIDWDAEPTITPVMDLSQVTKDADAISKMLSVTEVKASANYSQARGIVAAEDARRATQSGEDKSVSEVSNVKFEQNIYSPKELSTEEIYRRTKNQISLLRKGVSASDNRL